ncbi:MAG: hypothetical protein HXY50_12040 [Ignavibacteriaceae bacterium]|nr:hypothetical protein [Ignavibacteriaceae bacterium]
MKLKSRFLLFLLFVAASISFNCSNKNLHKDPPYPLQKMIVIPEPTAEQLTEFNADIESEFTTIEKGTKKISGYRTNNKLFLQKIITPIIKPHLKELVEKSPSEIINTLTLFGYEIFQKYLGQNFYRWGGDIFDLDDPQDRSHRYQCTYGLDCSGFAALPYELAVHYNLLPKEEALFASKGYEFYCSQNQLQDVGGREETSNNFRLDTRELAELGKVVFKLEKNQTPTPEQINLLKPGDIVGRSGHFGIIAFINGEPYYLESGGWVVPKNNGVPVKAIEALKIFAASGSITIRRCLE